MSKSKYEAIKHMIPYPSHINHLHGMMGNSVEFAYVFEGVMTVHNQFRWINSIKCYFERKVNVAFEWLSYFELSDLTISSGVIYSLKELNESFGTFHIKYPNLFFTKNRKDLYKHIFMYASALYYQKIMHLEGIYAGALKLVQYIPRDEKTPSNKALWGMAKSIVEYISNNTDKYKQKLDEKELEQALSSGGKTRGVQKKKEALANKENIIRLSKLPKYQKNNKKPSPSLIAKSLNLRRETVSRILSSLAKPHKGIA